MEFRISSELKNIIGQDLIVNDQVAIFELVKNSYDAHATRVDIIFEENKITIRDNGKGMSLKDLKNKWLFVAYSAKKNNEEDEKLKSNDRYKDYRNKINLKRGFAGAKGIGRFSADKIGENLRLIAKDVNANNANQLDIDWKDFEKNSQDEFVNISVIHTELAPSKYKEFNNGVILEISNLKSEWGDDKIEALEKSLSKLINPFEINTKSNNFQIYITKQDSDISKPISNDLVDILTLKTTKLEITISEKLITSTLIDRDTLIYNIEEENHYRHLKNTSIILLYLNTKAKTNFTRIMKVKAVNFGNIMLYNNGFRVYPYGEPNDDSLDIDRRHQQGHSRYLSTRNLIGSINVNEYSNEFKEKTSRDSGLIETAGYTDLYNLFWEKALKRLEKYVVGTQWSLDEIIRNQDGNSDDFSVLDNAISQSKIIDIITNLVDKDKVKIKNFDANFINLFDRQKPSEIIVSKLSKIAHDTNNQELIDKINETKKVVKRLEQGNKALKEEIIKEQNKATQLSKDLETEKKQNIFQRSLIGTEKEQIIGLQHQIRHSSSRIKRNTKLLLKSFDAPLSERQQKYIGVIVAEATKVNSIANLVTKANFNLTTKEIKVNLVSFIKEYIEELYLSNGKIIDKLKTKLNITISNNEFIMRIRPLEITTLIDNFIQNSKKANAKNIHFKLNVKNDIFDMLIIDDGDGIQKENIDKIFDFGFTTTDGSGIGLSSIKKTINDMHYADINVKSTKGKETIFHIRIRK
ncbi:putative two-component system sensor histidine kinase, putative heat shock protein [uncultured Candidatus Thioglobus sp.]|nr:putative two-component system sensor histidine kinase, putative heat shock protein [uncultured Candidatus Thioglobus sp.]